MRYQGWRWGQRANFDKLVFSPVLPRCLRIEFPAVFYLMMARGNRRETISHDDDDRRFFIATLSEGCAITGWRRMVERLDRRAVEEEIKTCGMPVMAEATDARCSHLRRGWYWGSQEFAGKLHELSGKLTKAERNRHGPIGARRRRRPTERNRRSGGWKTDWRQRDLLQRICLARKDPHGESWPTCVGLDVILDGGDQWEFEFTQ
jgi:hypothetical protein